MSTNAEEFNKQIKEVIRDWLPEKVWQFQRYVTLEALRRIVLKTPVDTGRARGNWQVTLSRPASGEVDKSDKGGASTITKGTAIVSKIPPFGIVYITNNVPYILKLEKGSSKQAPAGMVDITIQELLGLFR